MFWFIFAAYVWTFVSRTCASTRAQESPEAQMEIEHIRCASESDCLSPLDCLRLDASGIQSCDGQSDCYCVLLEANGISCENDSDCPLSQTCKRFTELFNLCLSNGTLEALFPNVNQEETTNISLTEQPNDTTPFITVQPNENPLPAEQEVCIDVNQLQHLQHDQLMYGTHRWAHVLCDSNENCATPGHIVVYKERAIMMRNYCELVSCSLEIRRVNSPKYRVGLLINSNTEDLRFTAFAARYGTWIEERLLDVAVRVGF